MESKDLLLEVCSILASKDWFEETIGILICVIFTTFLINWNTQMILIFKIGDTIMLA